MLFFWQAAVLRALPASQLAWYVPHSPGAPDQADRDGYFRGAAAGWSGGDHRSSVSVQRFHVVRYSALVQMQPRLDVTRHLTLMAYMPLGVLQSYVHGHAGCAKDKQPDGHQYHAGHLPGGPQDSRGVPGPGQKQLNIFYLNSPSDTSSTLLTIA